MFSNEELELLLWAIKRGYVRKEGEAAAAKTLTAHDTHQHHADGLKALYEKVAALKTPVPPDALVATTVQAAA